MSISSTLAAELQHEANNTRKLFERVPAEKLTWKPHEKSMTLGQLAGHIAEMPLWIEYTLKTDTFDMATSNYKPFVPTSAEDLVSFFDKNLKIGLDALEGSTDEIFMKNWKMHNGDIVFFDMPRIMVIRNTILNHLYHHRGQLTVYLRMQNVPLPAIMGPTADEN